MRASYSKIDAYQGRIAAALTEKREKCQSGGQRTDRWMDGFRGREGAASAYLQLINMKIIIIGKKQTSHVNCYVCEHECFDVGGFVATPK